MSADTRSGLMPALGAALGCLVAGLTATPLHAQFGTPFQVTYKTVEIAPFEASLQSIHWATPAGTWTAAFGPAPSPSPRRKGPKVIRVTDPSGRTQTAWEDPRARAAIWDTLTGSFPIPPPEGVPYIEAEPGMGRRVHLGETAAPGDWVVHRILWHVGGVSGPPPLPFLLVATHRKSGRWIAVAGEVDYPPTPDRGDIMGVETTADQDLMFWWWTLNDLHTGIRRSWVFHGAEDVIAFKEGTPAFALFTHNGAVATLAPTPREALRRGYLEAAWHLRTWNGRGGIAEASGTSPRRFTCEDDAQGAPILPEPGTRPFLWARELYVVPWKGTCKRMALREVLPTLKPGRWGIVLFRLRNGAALATRLVELPPGPWWGGGTPRSCPDPPPPSPASTAAARTAPPPP